MNENFKELGILGDYIGERSKIVTYEFDSQIGYDNFPVKIIKSNGNGNGTRL